MLTRICGDSIHSVYHLVSSREVVSDNVQVALYVAKYQPYLKSTCPVEEEKNLPVEVSRPGATLVLDLATTVVLWVITTTVLLATCCWKFCRAWQTARVLSCGASSVQHSTLRKVQASPSVCPTHLLRHQ